MGEPGGPRSPAAPGPCEEQRLQWRAEGSTSLNDFFLSGGRAWRLGGRGQDNVQVQLDCGLLLGGGIGDQK